MNSRMASKRLSSESAKVLTKGAFRDINFDDFAVLSGWEPTPGKIYTKTRAISARINQNFDGWPSEELKKSYKTFLGKPVFVNHVNDDPRKARGVVVAARFVDNEDDKYIEVVQEVDADKFPKLAHELATGGLDSVSMGCEAALTICSYCGNEATDLTNMCEHVLRRKGQVLGRANPDGTHEDVLVYETCRDIKFFELSYVFDPADETAVVSNVLTASKKTAYGETTLPPSVDTLRDEQEDVEGYFVDPPEQFKEPDLDQEYPTVTRRDEQMAGRRRSRRRKAQSDSVVYDEHAQEATVWTQDGREVVVNLRNMTEDERQEDLAWLERNNEQYEDFDPFDTSGRFSSRRGRKRPVARRRSNTRRRANNWEEGTLTGEEIYDLPGMKKYRSEEGMIPAYLRYTDGDMPDTVVEDPEGGYSYISGDGSLSGRSNSAEEAMKLLSSQKRRGRVSRNRRRTRFAEDRSRNDQGEQEEAFISQTPPAEPVDLGDGDGDEPNSTKDQRVHTDRNRSNHTNFEARRRRARNRARRRRLAEQSDDFNLKSRSDIARDVEDDEVQVSETGPATQPKDASRRKSRRRVVGQFEVGDMVEIEGKPGVAEVYDSVTDDVTGDRYYMVEWDTGDYDELPAAALRHASRRRARDRSFSNQTDQFQSWFYQNYRAEDFDDYDEESKEGFVQEYLDTKTARRKKSRAASRRKMAGQFQEGDEVALKDDPVCWGTVLESPAVDDNGNAVPGHVLVEWGDTGEVEVVKEEYVALDQDYKTSRRRRRVANLNWEDNGDGTLTALTDNGQELLIEVDSDGACTAGVVDGNGFLSYDYFDTVEEAMTSLASEYKTSRRRPIRRRRMADTNLDLAAPDGRVNVEAPTSGTTDEEAQASQFDKGDYGHNAGDHLADPDLSTDQNWAPGEGKKESKFTRRASQIEGMRLAEAMAELGLESYDDRWKLAESYTKLPAVTIQDRIALLERVASVKSSETQANVQRPQKSARRAPGLGQRSPLNKAASRSDDFTLYL